MKSVDSICNSSNISYRINAKPKLIFYAYLAATILAVESANYVNSLDTSLEHYVGPRKSSAESILSDSYKP